MPSRNITFDPDSGVPSASNLNLYTGADFSLNLNVKTVSNSAFDLTNYTGSSQLSISDAIFWYAKDFSKPFISISFGSID